MSSIDRQFSAAPRAALPQQKQCPARKSRRTEDTNDCVETRTTRNIIQDENGRGQDRMRKNRAQRAPAKPSPRPRYSENAKQDRGIRTPEGGLKTSGVEKQLVDLAPNEPTSSSAPNTKTPPHPEKRIKPPTKEHQSSCQHNRGRAQKAPPVNKLMISNVREHTPEPRVLTEIVQEGGKNNLNLWSEDENHHRVQHFRGCGWKKKRPKQTTR